MVVGAGRGSGTLGLSLLSRQGPPQPRPGAMDEVEQRDKVHRPPASRLPLPASRCVSLTATPRLPCRRHRRPPQPDNDDIHICFDTATGIRDLAAYKLSSYASAAQRMHEWVLRRRLPPSPRRLPQHTLPLVPP